MHMSLDLESVTQIATALAIGLGVTGPGIAIGMIGSSAMSAMGRNPEAQNAIRTNAILFIALAEALAIFSLVIAFIIKFA